MASHGELVSLGRSPKGSNVRDVQSENILSSIHPLLIAFALRQRPSNPHRLSAGGESHPLLHGATHSSHSDHTLQIYAPSVQHADANTATYTTRRSPGVLPSSHHPIIGSNHDIKSQRALSIEMCTQQDKPGGCAALCNETRST